MQAGHRPVVIVDPRRPVFAHFFEAKRWMMGVLPPKQELLLRLSLNLARKLRELFAKGSGRCRFHRAALPPPPRFPSEHRAKPDRVRQLSHRLRTLDLMRLRDARQSNAPNSRIALLGAIGWLLRFRAVNSRLLISFNRAANARLAARLKQDGAAGVSPRKRRRLPKASIDLDIFNGATNCFEHRQILQSFGCITSVSLS